jgi:hypothetical protein
MRQAGSSTGMPLNERGELETGGEVVPPLPADISVYLDRTIAIFGASGSGKSKMVLHFMELLRPSIELALAVATTEPSNNTYRGRIDAPYIHYSMFREGAAGGKKKTSPKEGAINFLTAIWDRQTMVTAAYRKANNRVALARLFARLPARLKEQGTQRTAALHSKRKAAVAALAVKYTVGDVAYNKAKDEIDAKCAQAMCLIWKASIALDYARLSAIEDLPEDERWCLAYLKLNPRLLLIFDDCAADLKGIARTEILRKFFYQNRHSFITVILTFQDDTDLDTNLRKNAFVSIFTDATVARSNFERGSNQFSAAMKGRVEKILPEVFDGHRKLAFIRDDRRGVNLYHITAAETAPRLFGSAAVRELASAVGAAGGALDETNPYYSAFKVS